MIINGIYIILALLGLGFLIFIHELGHYLMARRVRMKIEVFSIGFGKPILSWTFQGVRWQLGCLPFGGYVKIAGDQQKDLVEGKALDPDTFYGKSPWARIKVALMGPFVNIVFAFFLFAVIWVAGGKQEPFAKYTSIIGYVDPRSELYAQGVRAGDQIIEYNGHKFRGFKDLLYASILKQDQLEIAGYKINYLTQEKKLFHYNLKPYVDGRSKNQDIQTIGITHPASFLLFSQAHGEGDFSLENSPMKDSGIAYGDRVIWANNELVFSLQQLTHLVNEPKVLLTIQRGEE
ncbi:MAG: peptidase, partial [Chlamydiae bacterium]|nr:peptidase [Chlamydiota bacterium]